MVARVGVVAVAPAPVVAAGVADFSDLLRDAADSIQSIHPFLEIVLQVPADVSWHVDDVIHAYRDDS